MPALSAISVVIRAAAGGNRIVDFPRDVVLVELLKNCFDIELGGELIVDKRIAYKSLGCAAGHGGNPIRGALAGYGRKPAVRNRKLRSHEVVVVQIALIVVAHGALADQIRELAIPVARLCVAFGGMHKAVHQDRAIEVEVVTVDVSVTLEPRRGHVVDTGALELEQAELLAFVVVIGEARQFVINPVDGVGISVVADVPAVGLAIWIEHAEISVEAAVFLQHEHHVLNAVERSCSSSSARTPRSTGGVAAASSAGG